MTGRERFVQSFTFGKPDRAFHHFGRPRRSTYAAWYLQGLPRMNESSDFGQPLAFGAFTGMDHLERNLPIERGALPPFEEKIIEETERGRIWQDSTGIIVHDAGRNLNTPGFRTRTFVSHPVKSREDWARMKVRYDPSSPGRYPDDWDQLVAQYKDRHSPILVTVPGLYWKARDWVGFEALSMMFYDDPTLVHEMMEHVTVFIMDLLDRAMRDGLIDAVSLGEDMAYKHAAMISPTMFREFMLPRYKRLVRRIKDRGIPIVMVDSDGHIGQLIPLWIEAGVDVTWPIEIAAHNDPVAYRKRYGKQIALWGGIDKREIRSRERVYAEVMGKVPWLIDQGGYIPMFDHGVPPMCPCAVTCTCASSSKRSSRESRSRCQMSAYRLRTDSGRSSECGRQRWHTIQTQTSICDAYLRTPVFGLSVLSMPIAAQRRQSATSQQPRDEEAESSCVQAAIDHEDAVCEPLR